MSHLHAKVLLQRDAFTLDVDLQLPSRGVTALFGPSGCGKTTFLRAVAGLEPEVRGRLEVAGQVWQDGDTFVPTHERRVGFVFQEPSLFEHLDVRGNLEYGLKRRSGDVSLDQAVELLGLTDLMDRRPHQLSGGQQQRVAMARALASSPVMLLLDEPLAALDDKLKQEILPYLERLHQELDIPVLYVTHSRDEVARLADHLVLLDEGRALASGPLEEIFARLDLPLARQRGAETVIEAVVAGRDEEYGLLSLAMAPGGSDGDGSGDQFTVAAGQGRRHDVGHAVRLQIKAKDVSLTLSRQTDTSILNVFPAVVEELLEVDGPQITVRLLLGIRTSSQPLLAHITRKSAHALDLAPGKEVFAQVKTVAVIR